MDSRRARTITVWLLAIMALGQGFYARGQEPAKPTKQSAADDKAFAYVTTQGWSQDMTKHMDSGEMPFVMRFGAGQAGAMVYSGDLEYRFGDKAVKGAPFSAQTSSEMTQTLANGVHITHKTTGATYRDSEGRVRREQTVQDGPQFITIMDPVASAVYTLRPSEHAATKISFGGADSAPGTFFVHTETASGGHTIDIRGGEPASTAVSGGSVAAGTMAVRSKILNGTEIKPKTESLGTQVIEGVNAEGTRSTITIPAGTEGNDQPFDIVSERWYSPDLQMVVLSSHTDPRVGESVYRVTNINRAEPAHSLFEVPTDYTVNEEKGFTFKTAKPKGN